MTMLIIRNIILKRYLCSNILYFQNPKQNVLILISWLLRSQLIYPICKDINMGLDFRKPVFRGFENNKGADQPAHPGRLNSTFVIRILESTISGLAISEISIFQLVSVAEETGLSLAMSDPKTGFVTLSCTQ